MFSSADINQSFSRLGTHAEKYDLCLKKFGTEDVLPMWVADQDLPTPPFIIDAFKQRLEHPLLGYTLSSDELYQAIINWQAQHGYEVKANQIVFTHNVANGFFLAVQAFTQAGDSILIQPPIYPPFFDAPINNQRNLVEAPLVLENNRYQIDFEAFENKIIQHQVKLFLLCNPQNPSGRVWTKTELTKLVEICAKHQVIIVSDEIHSDLVFAPNKHTPTATVSDVAKDITITLSSPGKTFNLGGLQIGYAITANPTLKQQYLNACKANCIDGLNLFAQIAVIAAYSKKGNQWRQQLLEHFADNINTLKTFLAKEFPKIKLLQPEAGFLVWLDFKQQFASHETLKNWLIKEAKLGLNDGQSFGKEVGTGFMRINIAVSRETLQQALLQLKNAK